MVVEAKKGWIPPGPAQLCRYVGRLAGCRDARMLISLSAADPVFAERTLAVWHDGTRPLCRKEIAAMRRLDTRGAIRFVDAATAEQDECPADMSELLARFCAALGQVRRETKSSDIEQRKARCRGSWWPGSWGGYSPP